MSIFTIIQRFWVLPMVRASLQPMSIEEFLALPETKPASEYIDGKVIQKPMPGGKHSAIQGDLSATIDAALRPPKIARAAIELSCTFDGRSIVPDIAVLKWANIPRDETGAIADFFASPPDWIIEIFSPEQSYNRLTEKILHCLSCGTELGWIIDPDDVTVVSLKTGKQPQFFGDLSDVLPVPSFAVDLEITIEDLEGFLRV